jgi:hypothetical protein
MALGFNRGIYQLKTTINYPTEKKVTISEQCWRGKLIQPSDLLVTIQNDFYSVNPYRQNFAKTNIWDKN